MPPAREHARMLMSESDVRTLKLHAATPWRTHISVVTNSRSASPVKVEGRKVWRACSRVRS